MPAASQAVFENINARPLQSGDPNSFRQLYKMMGNTLLKEARLRCVRDEDGTVIVYLSFITCWLQSKDLDTTDQVIGMLHVALLRYIKALKRGDEDLWREASLLRGILSSRLRPSGFTDNVASSITDAGTPGDLVRDVFYRYFRHHMSVDEIAGRLRLSTTKTRGALVRAANCIRYMFS